MIMTTFEFHMHLRLEVKNATPARTARKLHKLRCLQVTFSTTPPQTGRPYTSAHINTIDCGWALSGNRAVDRCPQVRLNIPGLMLNE